MSSTVSTSEPVAVASENSPGAAIPYERYLSCVHCGLCTSACPTYLETGNENDSPRGRIYLMRAVTDGRTPLTPAIERHLDLCLDCRSCETACPSGVQYGRLIEPFRIGMRKMKPSTRTPRWFEKWILHGLLPRPAMLRAALAPARWLQQLGLDQWVDRSGAVNWLPGPLQRMYRLLPRLQPRPPQLAEPLSSTGPRRARVGLFTGCVGDAMFAQVNHCTALVLQHNGCDVAIPPAQTCCGAIHFHSGSGEPALQLATANAAAFSREPLDAIIVNVAGCGSMLKDYGHVGEELAPASGLLQEQLASCAARVRDVHEFLVQLGPVPARIPIPLTVTYHDACHLCHAQQIRQQPRQLLALIPELKVVPLPESEICCGAAGSYNLTEPEMADQLGRRKVERILATGAQGVVTANAGCSLQIQAMLKAAGRSDIPVWHPMELLAHSYGLSSLDLKQLSPAQGKGQHG